MCAMKKIIVLLMVCMLGLAACAPQASSTGDNVTSQSASSSNDSAEQAEALAQNGALAGTWVANVEDNGESFTFTLDLSEEGTWSLVQGNAQATGEPLGSGTYVAQGSEIDFMGSAGQKEFNLKVSPDGTTLFERDENEPAAYTKQ